MRIFVAGATGLIGVRLVPLLTGAGHVVAGLTRSPEKAGMLKELGAEAVVVDVYDATALTEAVKTFAPHVVFHQLTDLPDNLADLASQRTRNDRMRTEGTSNLLQSARAANAKVIAQSISWELEAEGPRQRTAQHERRVLDSNGVVIRYGQFYGPGTYYPETPPDRPRIHIDDAARLTLASLDVPPGVTMVIDDRTL